MLLCFNFLIIRPAVIGVNNLRLNMAGGLSSYHFVLPTSSKEGGLHSRFKEDKSLIKRVRVNEPMIVVKGRHYIILYYIILFFSKIIAQGQNILHQIFPQP